MKSNDFRNYTLGDIEKICEITDLCENCPANIVCEFLYKIDTSWENAIKQAEKEMKKYE